MLFSGAVFAAFVAFFGIAAVAAATTGDPVVAAACVLATAWFGSLGWFLLRYRLATRKSDRGIVLISAPEGRPATCIRYPRGLLAALGVWVGASAAGLVWVGVELASSGSWVPAALLGSVGLALTALLAITATGRGVFGGVVLTPDHVQVRGRSPDRVLRWDEVVALSPQVRYSGWVRTRSLVVVGSGEHSALARRGRDLVLPCEDLDADPLVAFHTIRFYLQNPTLRAELGTEASLSRIRRRDLPGGHPSP